jgi:hypothetical protein
MPGKKPEHPRLRPRPFGSFRCPPVALLRHPHAPRALVGAHLPSDVSGGEVAPAPGASFQRCVGVVGLHCASQVRGFPGGRGFEWIRFIHRIDFGGGFDEAQQLSASGPLVPIPSLPDFGFAWGIENPGLRGSSTGAFFDSTERREATPTARRSSHPTRWEQSEKYQRQIGDDHDFHSHSSNSSGSISSVTAPNTVELPEPGATGLLRFTIRFDCGRMIKSGGM